MQGDGSDYWWTGRRVTSFGGEGWRVKRGENKLAGLVEDGVWTGSVREEALSTCRSIGRVSRRELDSSTAPMHLRDPIASIGGARKVQNVAVVVKVSVSVPLRAVADYFKAESKAGGGKPRTSVREPLSSSAGQVAAALSHSSQLVTHPSTACIRVKQATLARSLLLSRRRLISPRMASASSSASVSLPSPTTPNSNEHPRPSSPFSASPTSIPKPPLARLQSSFGSNASTSTASGRASALSSPWFLDSLTRATLPSSSISESVARHPDLSSPRGERSAILPGGSPPLSSSSRKASGAGGRHRSASAGSLKSLLERERGNRGSGSLSLRRSSGAEELPPIEDEPSQPGLDQLSWGTKWWPFAVVEPDVKGKGRAVDATQADGDGAGLAAEQDPHASARGFMALFGGQGAVEHAREQRDAARANDQAEAELLDADLESLTTAATALDVGSGRETPRYREADEGSPKSVRTAEGSRRESSSSSSGSSPKKPTSYLSTSMFSSASTSRTSPTLDGPSSIFSSFSLSNPFAPSPSPPVHRRYSHSSKKSSDDDGPTAKRSEVTQYLDEEDTKTAKEEDDHHMDVFSLIKDRYTPPKHPIVFCHGLFGFDVLGPAAIKPLQFQYWIGVKEAMEAMGAEVLIGRVPASASIEERAKVLCEQIEQAYPGREVNLIGHSMVSAGDRGLGARR